ncbi:hypothetical protein [Microtetraspora glauca]|uniref:Uncharacterized protein n=1 Tax=Microtetraspora glauca TaxID=1996 RepID=A0ABV3GT84_MICGL
MWKPDTPSPSCPDSRRYRVLTRSLRFPVERNITAAIRKNSRPAVNVVLDVLRRGPDRT